MPEYVARDTTPSTAGAEFTDLWIHVERSCISLLTRSSPIFLRSALSQFALYPCGFVYACVRACVRACMRVLRVCVIRMCVFDRIRVLRIYRSVCSVGFLIRPERLSVSEYSCCEMCACFSICRVSVLTVHSCVHLRATGRFVCVCVYVDVCTSLRLDLCALSRNTALQR